MGNLLGGSDGGNAGFGQSGLGSQSQCCDPKVDPISILVTIGAIAAAAAFLRQAVIDNNVMMRRRKRRALVQDFQFVFGKGKVPKKLFLFLFFFCF